MQVFLYTHQPKPPLQSSYPIPYTQERFPSASVTGAEGAGGRSISFSSPTGSKVFTPELSADFGDRLRGGGGGGALRFVFLIV
eukprot:1332178-Amorphochlora_amoeboformis.AAC.1